MTSTIYTYCEFNAFYCQSHVSSARRRKTVSVDSIWSKGVNSTPKAADENIAPEFLNISRGRSILCATVPVIMVHLQFKIGEDYRHIQCFGSNCAQRACSPGSSIDYMGQNILSIFRK